MLEQNNQIDHNKVLEDFCKKQKERIKKLKAKQKKNGKSK